MRPIPTLPLEATGVPEQQQVNAAPAPATTVPQPTPLLGLAERAAQLADFQRAYAESSVPQADEHSLSVIAGVGGLLGALTGAGDVATGTLNLIQQRKRQRQQDVDRALGSIERAVDEVRRQDQREQEAKRQVGIGQSALRARHKLSPDQQAVIEELVAAGAGEEALRQINIMQDNNRSDYFRNLDAALKLRGEKREIEIHKLKVKAMADAERNRWAEDFYTLTPEQQRKRTEKAAESWSKTPNIEATRNLLSTILKLRQELGDLSSDEAAEKLRGLVDARGFFAGKVNTDTLKNNTIYMLLQDLVVNRAFQQAGKSLTGSEKEAQEFKNGIRIGGITGLVGLHPKVILSGIKKIEDAVFDELSSQHDYYKQRSPVFIDNLTAQRDLLGPGVYASLKAIAGKADGYDLEKPPPMPGLTPAEQKQRAANWSTLRYHEKLKIFVDYLEKATARGLPLPPKRDDSVRTPTDLFRQVKGHWE